MSDMSAPSRSTPPDGLRPPAAVPRDDRAAWARRLAVSQEAIDLYAETDVIDLHIESFIWTRLVGYDLWRRHGRGLFGARFYSQVDLPRLIEGGLTGAVFSIATWPFRRRALRTAAFLRNLSRLRRELDRSADRIAIVTNGAGYRRARAEGKVAIWIGVQGGNALDSARGDLGRIPDDLVTRITLVHLTRSTLGGSSAPAGGIGIGRGGGAGGEEAGGGGLTRLGREFVSEMNHRRILVDLAHISRRGFKDALDVHGPSQPAIVSHTGASGVTPHWRNVDDDQIRAIARTGGVIGVMFHGPFLGQSWLGGKADAIVRHLEHVIRVGGEDAAALGSDWDGMISTPRDMPTVLELPVLVERMLAARWTSERIRRVLGGNALRVMSAIRP